MFIAIVLGTLLSGLEVFCLSEHDLQRLDSFVVKCLRMLLRGDACSKVSTDLGVTYKSLSNDDVHVRTKVAHVKHILLYRRMS